MSTRNKESDARIVIDRLLREAGWDIENKSQVLTEESAHGGKADYLLLDSNGRPLAIIEAKRFTKNPNLAQDQAKEYADSIHAPFIFLTNGELIYFWDYKNQPSHQIDSFYNTEDLQRRALLTQHRKPLKDIEIPEKFYYFNKEIEVRPYQKEAIKKVDEAMANGRKRILLEMATGTGKTLTMAMMIKRFFQAGLIERVLFLVDRRNLAEQTKDSFAEYLKGYEPKVWYGGKQKELGRVVIGTLPTIASQLERFSPGHFDLVVTDECHRSIYNVYRDLLNHFDALQIGLTATPNLGQYEYVNEKEKRLVRNTYEFYDSWNHVRQKGTPVFAYDIVDGIKDGFLASYEIYLAKTRITMEGLTYEGVDYKPSELERSITVRSRNRLMVEEFREHEYAREWRERKTLVFAVTKNHAAQLKEHFDAVFSEYKGNYAKIITSDSPNPDQILADFKKQQFPVCLISVGMLDTGIDVPNVENLIMMRPTVSAILYQQIRGRGVRLDESIGKGSFLIYDFVGNAEKFNDPMLIASKPGEKGLPLDFVRKVEEAKARAPKDFVIVAEHDMSDEIKLRETIHVGPEGMAIDRKTYQEEFASEINKIKSDVTVEKILTDKVLNQKEIDELAKKLNTPKYFFNEENLREAYGEPVGSIVDFIKAALGKFKFSTKEERVEKAYSSWVIQKNLNPDQTKILIQLKDRFVAGDTEITAEDFTKPPFSLQGGLSYAISIFGEERLKEVLDEMNKSVLV